jgi:hypothetical protein
MLVFCFVDVVKFLFLVLLVYGDVVVIVWCSCFFDILLFSLGEECLHCPTLHHFLSELSCGNWLLLWCLVVLCRRWIGHCRLTTLCDYLMVWCVVEYCCSRS